MMSIKQCLKNPSIKFFRLLVSVGIYTLLGGCFNSASSDYALADGHRSRASSTQSEINSGSASPDSQADTSPKLPVTSTGRLNDTGMSWGANYPTGVNTGCLGETVKAQDCSQGRDAEFNDDTDGRAGFSFTKLDENGQPLSATASSWSCVKDNVTGLIWEIKQGGNGIPGDEGLHDPDDLFAWFKDGNGERRKFDTVCYGASDSADINPCRTDQFIERVNAESKKGYCGYSDWRLPTRAELRSIVDYSKVNPIHKSTDAVDTSGLNPMIETRFFPGTRPLDYWNYSIPASGSQAWTVSFETGDDNLSFFGTALPVRLVRDGPSVEDEPCQISTDDYELLDEGLVRHVPTGLIWKRCREGQQWENETCTGKPDFVAWDAALGYPGAVNSSGGYAGVTDWRLPNIKEALSIAVEGCSSPAFNDAVFLTSEYTEDVWTSTPNLDFNDEGQAWKVEYTYGTPYIDPRTDDVAGVRLVRSGK